MSFRIGPCLSFCTRFTSRKCPSPVVFELTGVIQRMFGLTGVLNKQMPFNGCVWITRRFELTGVIQRGFGLTGILN